MQITRYCLLVAVAGLCLVKSARAEYVLPQIGGGQVGQGSAPMKHADISFDGQNLEVQIDPTVATPVLRPLEPPNEFDLAEPWGVLGTKAYNFQYGWNPGGFILVPEGSWIWMEALAATPGLEVYQRPPASPAYDPIFGTDGSPARWRWNGSMTHNVYAVQDPVLSLYEADYRVYLGDDATGEPLPGYGAAEVTFWFIATPDVLDGDYNDDGQVDAADYTVWRDSLGMAVMLPGDTTPGTVDESDYTTWHDNFGNSRNSGSATTSAGSIVAAVPEPAGWLVAALAAMAVLPLRPQRGGRKKARKAQRSEP